MSILLEALKKSERQRQLGQTPNIHAQLEPPGPDAGPGQPWIPAVLVGVSAIAMAWFGWQQYRAPEAIAEPVVAVAKDDSAASGGGSDEVRSTPPTATVGTAADASAAQAARPPGAKPRASRRTPVESFQVEGKSLQGVTVMPPGQETQAGSAKARVARPVRNIADASTASGTATNSAPADAGGQGVAPPATPSPDAVHGSEPISFWELPQGVRDSLPEMRITVLVYAEQPENRFILLGGERLVENDEVQPGIVLEEIRREGAVFLYRNYRFLVKG